MVRGLLRKPALTRSVVVWLVKGIQKRKKGAAERRRKADEELDSLLTVLEGARGTQGGRTDLAFYSMMVAQICDMK